MLSSIRRAIVVAAIGLRLSIVNAALGLAIADGAGSRRRDCG